MSDYAVDEAARRLGVSVVTVRRRIGAGTLAATQDATTKRWTVHLEGNATDAAVLRERVALLERERADLVAELEARRREAEAADTAQSELRRLLSQAQAMQARLMPGGSFDTDGNVTMPGTMTEQPPSRRRWWQRGGETRGA